MILKWIKIIEIEIELKWVQNPLHLMINILYYYNFVIFLGINFSAAKQMDFNTFFWYTKLNHQILNKPMRRKNTEQLMETIQFPALLISTGVDFAWAAQIVWIKIFVSIITAGNQSLSLDWMPIPSWDLFTEKPRPDWWASQTIYLPFKLFHNCFLHQLARRRSI